MSQSHGFISSPIAEAAEAHVDSLVARLGPQQHGEAHDHASTAAESSQSTAASNRAPQAPQAPQEQPYVSKIGILATSLPRIHNQMMKAKKEDEERQRVEQQHAQDEGEPLEPHEAEMLSKMSLEVGTHEQTSEQQAETARRLKPHSRSTVRMYTILNSQDPAPPELHHGTPKKKTPKWQFGIRSKNEPLDAIKCLYKALQAMGDCQWQIPPPKDPSKTRKATAEDLHGPYPVNVEGATHITSGDANLSESPEKDRHIASDTTTTSTTTPATSANTEATSSRAAPADKTNIQDDSDSEHDSEVDIDNPPEGYFPKDPWCIHVRWEKVGMSPPGAVSSGSAQSSRVDLSSTDGSARRNSAVLGSLSSAAGSATSVTGAADSSKFDAENTACFVYLDLQIYSIEMETYLVDFKCAGYEAIVGSEQVMTKRGLETQYFGSGHRVADKDVTSPQPFLDLANKLVIHLANKN